MASDTEATDTVEKNKCRDILLEVTMLNRRDIRNLFGITFANQWGHFTDQWMSPIIHSYLDWVQYPKGDHGLVGHSKSVTSAVFSDDGYYLFTGSEDKRIIVWDLLDNSKKDEWIAHEKFVECLAYAAGLLASGSKDGSIRIWNADNHRMIYDLRKHRRLVQSVAFNNEGNRLVSGSSDQSIRIWGMKSGVCLGVLRGHFAAVTSVRFVGEDIVISGGWDRSLKIWTLPFGIEQNSISESVNVLINVVCVNSDATLAACLFSDGFTVYRWPEMSVVRRVIHRVLDGGFHPSFTDVLVVMDDWHESIMFFDITKEEWIHSLDVYRLEIRAICFSPDGSRMVSVSKDQSIKIWDISEFVDSLTRSKLTCSI